MNESARRWSGYVCPDCRFVFRVPLDHDGHGVVCQSCRRLLRIPAAGEPTPPLLMAFDKVAEPVTDVPIAGGAARDTMIGRIRRKVRKRRSAPNSSGADGQPSWDRHASRANRYDRRAMHWMLGGAVLLLALIAGGGFVALRGHDTRVADPQPAPAEPLDLHAAAAGTPAAPPAPRMRSQSAILAEAAPLAGKFLGAGTVEELLPLVYKPDRAKPRMQRQYPLGTVDAPGLAEFNVSGNIVLDKTSALIEVRTRKFESRQLVFIETKDGLKIDWECWVGWSDMTWPALLASMPTTPQLFRVIVKRVDYYNFEFSDDKKWHSYRLESLDGEHMLFGYVERDSALDGQIQLSPDVGQMPMILRIRFTAAAVAASKQVLIEAKVADGWIETDD